MIEGPGLSREGHLVFPPTKFYFEKPLRYLDIGSTIFSHSAQLNEMRALTEFFHCPKQIQGSDYIVLLRVSGVLPIDHTIGCRRLFTKVNNSIWSGLS